LREQDKRRQEEKRLEQERERQERERQERRESHRQPADAHVADAHVAPTGHSAVKQEPPAPVVRPVIREATVVSASPVLTATAATGEAPSRNSSQEATGCSTEEVRWKEEKSMPHQDVASDVPKPKSVGALGQVKTQEQKLRHERTDERREPQRREAPRKGPEKPKLRSPGSYVLPVFAQHDRSNHAERQALIKVIARVQETCGAKTDAEFEAECAEVTGTVRLYASHTPCISCMACFCQFQRLFPKVKLCVDFDDWRDTRRMVELARREEEHKKRGTSPRNYDCAGLSDMSDEEEPVSDNESRGTPPAAMTSAHSVRI